jgi:integrase
VVQKRPDFLNSAEIRAFFNVLATYRRYTRGMSKVGKPSGLVQRKGSNSWYLRLRWPKRYARPGAPPEIWVTLGTADYKVALARLDDARVEANRRFREIEPAPSPTGIYSRSLPPLWPAEPTLPQLHPDQSKSLAQNFFQRAMRALDAEGPSPHGGLCNGLHGYRQELEDQQARLQSPDADDWWDAAHAAQISVLRDAGLGADPEGEAASLLRNYLRRAMEQVVAIRLARLGGDFSDRISDALFRQGVPQAVIPVVRKSEITFGQASDRYLAEVLDMRSVTAKTSLKHRSLLKHIGSFFGREVALCDIERNDCIRFRDTLSKLPPNFMKRGDADRPLIEIAEANVSGRRLAWETQNNYLAMLDDVMAWSLKERLIPDNVASDIPPLAKRDAAEAQRLPFQSGELQKIFNAPIFTGCADDELGFSKPGPNIIRRSRYWLPLVALFTGMRMGEILQLTPSHVRRSEAGTHFIVLTRDMKLKTENAAREIPLHPSLQSFGFVAWVEERRKAGAALLFDDVPESKHGYRSDTFTKRFATFLKRVDLISERRKKLCFHSLRHNFKDALNDTNAPEAEMDEICGWSRAKKTGRRYGSGFDADRLKPYVDQVRFDLDLSHIVVR